MHQVRAYELQVQKPARDMRNHRYHEPLDTHDVVLERRADSMCGDTMIHTVEKNGTNCLPMPAVSDLAYSHSIVNKPFLSFIFNGLFSC